MKKNFLLLAFGIFLIGGIFMVPNEVFAKTVYVKTNGDDSNDGSADHPYKTLDAAIEEVNEGDADEVKVGKGTFSGSGTFSQGVSIQGAGKGSTTLTGALVFMKKVSIKDITLRTKSKNAVVIGKSGTATIEDVDIRDFAGIGIWVLSGNGSLTVKNSRIGGGGKGIYAEAGTRLSVSGTSIVNNREEGLDIRNNTRGAIKNNTIENNSETGIELIVGSSDFVISGNDIRKNGASGIAYQFYESYKKFGTIVASGNTISSNHKMGIDCNKPQKGDTPAGYWADSITLEGNTFSGNGIADISTGCKIIEAKTEEDEVKLEDQLVEEVKKEEKTVNSADKQDPLGQERLHQETQLAEVLVEKIESVGSEEQYQEILRELQQKRNLQVILRGFEYESLAPLRTTIDNDQKNILMYQAPLGELAVYTTRTDLQERVLAKTEKLNQYQLLLASYQKENGVSKYISQDFVIHLNKFFYAFLF